MVLVDNKYPQMSDKLVSAACVQDMRRKIITIIIIIIIIYH